MIQVACFDISQMDSAAYDWMYHRASEERQARADRYIQREDKLRCVAADSLIRYAVERSLGVQGYDVEADSLGKPRIRDAEGFHFNISHSGRWVVIAYGASPVGIDVQELRRVGKEGIVRRFFTVDEQAYVFGAAGNRQNERFFQVWTGKESYLKYLGTGLRQSLDSFSVLGRLGVRLHSTFLDGACMTLCTEDSDQAITMLDLQQLIKE